MTTEIYFVIGALLAAYLAFFCDGQGDGWQKITAVIVIAALWPVALGAGVGLTVRDIVNGIRGLLA